MALSSKMLAVLLKVDAARAEFFAGLRETAKKDAKARAKTLEKKRENLRVARAIQAKQRAVKKRAK